MEFIRTRIPDVVLCRPRVFEDERGYFLETWNETRFREGGIEAEFVQDNQSGSARHVLRGLHYQIRQPQGKLVRIVAGEAYDVAVDLRRTSPTFGGWVGVRLTAGGREELWIPPGFAHGFLALSDRAEIAYKCTAGYAPEHERSIRWDDPRIGIDWPLVAGAAPLLSDKDRDAPLLDAAETFP